MYDRGLAASATIKHSTIRVEGRVYHPCHEASTSPLSFDKPSHCLTSSFHRHLHQPTLDGIRSTFVTTFYASIYSTIMHSPLSSPSLRAITHAHPHPHLPRNASYFTAHPPAPSPPRYHQPPSHGYATLVNPPTSIRVGSPRPTHEQPHGWYPSEMRSPARETSRPPMPRRASFRESAIPLRPTPPPHKGSRQDMIMSNETG